MTRPFFGVEAKVGVFTVLLGGTQHVLAMFVGIVTPPLLIGLTGVASRRVGYGVAGILVLLGFFPRVAALISVMPKPVLGGATTIMFAMVAVAGLKIVVSGGLEVRDQFILAVTLAAGLGIDLVPEAFLRIAERAEAGGILLGSLAAILRSGLAVGAITATVLNLVLPRESKAQSA
ncbi:MAG: solute carrier family 23 protein [Candidatus Erginobacter occultus]|nr:solute carrier family 23 protein [Candidatus Erginobacter occultus]